MDNKPGKAPGPDTTHIFPPRFSSKGLNPAHFARCDLPKLLAEIPDNDRRSILQKIYAENTSLFPEPEKFVGLLRHGWLVHDLESRLRGKLGLPVTVASLQVVLFCRSIRNVNTVLNKWRPHYPLPLNQGETMAIRGVAGNDNILGRLAKACDVLNRIPP